MGVKQTNKRIQQNCFSFVTSVGDGVKEDRSHPGLRGARHCLQGFCIEDCEYILCFSLFPVIFGEPSVSHLLKFCFRKSMIKMESS